MQERSSALEAGLVRSTGVAFGRQMARGSFEHQPIPRPKNPTFRPCGGYGSVDLRGATRVCVGRRREPETVQSTASARARRGAAAARRPVDTGRCVGGWLSKSRRLYASVLCPLWPISAGMAFECPRAARMPGTSGGVDHAHRRVRSCVSNSAQRRWRGVRSEV